MAAKLQELQAAVDSMEVAIAEALSQNLTGS